MRGIILSFLALSATAFGQKIASVVTDGAPYAVVDNDGNMRGFDPQQAILFDQSGTRPATVVLEQVGSAVFEVTLQNIPGPGAITATINGRNVFAPAQVESGNSGIVKVQLDRGLALTGSPWQMVGTVQWAYNGQVFDQTPIEVYAVSHTLPQYFQKYGIYRDLLQWILPQNDGSGNVPKDADAYNAYVVNKVHFESGHVYDTFAGASAYAMYGNLRDVSNPLQGTFKLRGWLNDINNMQSLGASAMVNCYDQASIVQICQSLGPTPMHLLHVCYLRPFGYIKATSLVGFPKVQVNSPFFRGDIQMANVPEEADDRTAFDNHMFAAIGEANSKLSLQVCDACAGPAQCDVSLQQYMDNAIDPDNAANAQEPPADLVRIGSGIQDFDTFNIGGDRRSFRVRRREVDAVTDLQKRLSAMGAKNENAVTSKVYRPDFNDLGSHLSHKVIQSDAVLGHDAAVFEYLYRINGDAKQDVRIRLTVADDYDSAFLALVHSVSQMSTKLESFWKGPANDNERFGAWTIDSKPDTMQGAIIFVDGNVFVDISGLKSSEDLQQTATEIHKFITNPPSKPESPTIGATSSNISVKVGDTKTINVDVSSFFKGDYKLQHGNVLVTYMKHESGKLELDLVGVKEGEEKVALIVFNGAGESVRKPLTVTVTK